MNIFDLIGGVKGVIVALAIAAVLGFIAWQRVQILQTKAAVETAMAATKSANDDRDKAIEANTANLGVIENMKQEKGAIDLALKNLEASRIRDAVVIGKLSKVISVASTDPENRVKLSPVLKQVVQGIQQARAARTARPGDKK